jgi:RHS repeat-associated protein
LLEYTTTTGTRSYTYTLNGTLRTKTVNGETTTYTHDALGNLIGVQLPDGRQIEYLYDGFQRRIGKRVNGTLTEAYLFDGTRPIAQLDGAGNIVARFVYASDRNTPSFLIKNGETYRIISDHTGSPRLIIHAGTGAIMQQLDYDEFGNALSDTNPGFQPFGFAGGLYDRDTTLVRFGARDYDAESGRWTAKDPIRFLGRDTNLFGYAMSDPVNASDLSGLSPNDCGCENVTAPQPFVTGPGMASEIQDTDGTPSADGQYCTCTDTTVYTRDSQQTIYWQGRADGGYCFTNGPEIPTNSASSTETRTRVVPREAGVTCRDVCLETMPQ